MKKLPSNTKYVSGPQPDEEVAHYVFDCVCGYHKHRQIYKLINMPFVIEKEDSTQEKLNSYFLEVDYRMLHLSFWKRCVRAFRMVFLPNHPTFEMQFALDEKELNRLITILRNCQDKIEDSYE